jgi:uncharacterized membrane protein
MAKKYDTNPLDADVFAHADREFARRQEAAKTNGNVNTPTALFEANTRPFAGQTIKTVEQPTQILDEFNPTEPYKSVLQNPMTNAPVSQAVHYHVERPTSRTVLGIGVPENIAMVLPYLPFQAIGGIVAVIVLLLAAKTETRVRFHAAQALALHIAWLLIGVVLTFAGEISNFAAFGGRIFSIGVMIFFIFSMWRVWKGKPHHIEALDDLTDFLNEKLKPRK